MNAWHIASGAACVVAALVLSVVVLHPNIKEGPLIKAGLIGMIFSLGATAVLTFTGSLDWPAYWRAAFTLRAGLALVCVGLLVRANSIGRKKRCEPDHHMMTRRWLYTITEPARDMVHLFSDDRQDRKERA